MALNEPKAGIGSNRKELEIDIKKYQGLIKKQDKLLCCTFVNHLIRIVCFSILYHLAENITIERKMMKRKIVPYLVKMLERNNIFLLICSTSFLKKLSVFNENKEGMVMHNGTYPLYRKPRISCPNSKGF